VSNDQTRADIVALASTVEGVTAYAKRPATLRSGDAWVRWRGAERADGFLFYNTWALIVLLSEDEQTADEQADRLAYELAAVLEDGTDDTDGVLFVTGMQPVAVASTAGDFKAIEVQGRSE